MSNTQYNASLHGKPDYRHLSIVFRLKNTGDVLLQYSRPVRNLTGEVVYPVRYYLMKEEWFIEVNSHKNNGKDPWPTMETLQRRKKPRIRGLIHQVLQAYLLSKPDFQNTWTKDVLDASLDQALSYPNGNCYRARIWSKHGPEDQCYQGDRVEQWWMQKHLLALCRGTQWLQGCEEVCLGSVSDVSEVSETRAPSLSSQNIDGVDENDVSLEKGTEPGLLIR
jgi:hypothetical protein